MKTTFRIALAVLCSAVILTGCHKDDLLTFSKSPDVYFLSNATTYADSTNISFAFIGGNVAEYDTSVLVMITGSPVARDRYAAVAVSDESTAQANVHYKNLSTSVLIPANQLTGKVTFTAIRTEDMQTNNYMLKILLQQSEDFTTDIRTMVVNNATGKTTNVVEYRFFITDILTKPLRWSDGFFGPFTRKKFQLICEVNQVPPSFINGEPWNGVVINPNQGKVYAMQTQIWLNDYNATHQIPYLDEDNSKMAMDQSIQDLFPVIN